MFKINNQDIINADLLSIEEAEEVQKWILANGEYWWLRSPGYDDSDNAAIVLDNGAANPFGRYVNSNYIGVRPALWIPNLSLLKIGDLVEVFGLNAQYIGDNSVLLCEPIDYRRFDEKSNDYETSEIKSYLDGWLKDKKGE